jgi:SAM-dependent methyltransferase
MTDNEKVRRIVRSNYSKVAIIGTKCGGCCCGSDCCGAPVDYKQISERLGYSESDLGSVPEASNMGLGCGDPVAIASLKDGETVLDLGSGGGFDCFLARQRVGDSGYVIGVDMTPDMINLARENARKSGYGNIEFRLGEIEHLPVADNSVDVILSNCVINLSPDKEQVFKEAYRVLKPGGRLSVSDVVATAELPEHVRKDLFMHAGCIAGAEYAENIRRMLERAGFQNIKLTPKDNSKEIISTWAPGKSIEEFVASYIIEAVK